MLTNSKIKELKSLHQKKYRDLEKLYLAEGIKIINEALETQPDIIESIYCTIDTEKKLKLKNNIEVIKIKNDLITKISSLKTPQNCIAVIKIKPENDFHFSKSDDIILALDSIRDPGNLGTIIRLADWFGISKIVCSDDCVDCYSPKVVQASMGALFRVNVFYKNLSDFFQFAKSENYNIAGATLEGKNIYETEIKFPSVIIMGSESEGISAISKSYISDEIKIPNYSLKINKTESLNVSTATSVILSEFRRRQYYSK